MRYEARFAVAGAAALALAATAPAGAQTAAVGHAAKVKQSVTGSLRGKSRALADGSDVFASESVRTGAQSAALLTFVESTDLTLGPLSQVTLERMIYAGGVFSQATIGARSGVFKFQTGRSDPRAFRITTPNAEITPNGTVLDISASGGVTIVVLKSGAARVCARGTNRCAQLVSADQYAIVRSGRVEGPLSGGTRVFQFAGACAQRGGGPICGTAVGGLPTTVDPASRGGAGGQGGSY